MPKLSTTPKSLRPFLAHGVDLDWGGGGGQARGECPFCSSAKFYVALETGKWDCLSGDSRILTRKGYRPIRELAGTQVELLSHMGWRTAPVRSGGVQEVFAIRLVRDQREKMVKATARHRWLLKDGGEVMTKDLIAGMKLRGVVAPRLPDSAADPEGIRHGLMFGDGNNGHIQLWGPKTGLLKYLRATTVAELGETENGVKGIRVNGQNKEYRNLPTLDCSDEYLLGFLQGYFATDGTASGQQCIDSKNETALEFVREAAARVGIATSPVSAYWLKGFPGHEGYCYRVAFHRSTLHPDFMLRDDHREALTRTKAWGGVPRLAWRVVSVESVGREEVYCAVVDGPETFALDDNLLTGNCKVCGEKGNALSFLGLVWDRGVTNPPELAALAGNRGLLSPETLTAWGVRQSPITREWIVPGWSPSGKLCQLYRYVPHPVTGKMVLLATPEFQHGLFAPVGFQHGPPREELHLLEGPWDAMAYWEALGVSKAGESGLVPTGNPEASLLTETEVRATPGASVLPDGWVSAFGGKRVALFFDSDHPKPNPVTKKLQPPAGLSGMKRVVQALSRNPEKPAEVRYLHWGDDGYDPERPSGFDVRDFLKTAPSPGARVKRVEELRLMLAEVPPSWVPGRAVSSAPGKVQVDTLPCSSWATLVNQWRKAMKWIDGLDRSLACMLASIASVETRGDQLWFKIIGPASCGKSVLAEAVSINEKYIKAVSTIRGFHSGYQADREGSIDSSLVAQLKNKTLVIKDGDTLLAQENLRQILSEARDIYDRVSRTSYRNQMSKDYKGINMTWLLLGTSSLRAIDSSELGERFLDSVVIEDIDPVQERDVALRVAFRAASEVGMIADGKLDTQDSPEMVLAKRLTGGYIDWLKENVHRKVAEIPDEEETMLRIVEMATFISYLRARPSDRQKEKAQREMCYRLTSQLVRLAKMLAVVLNRPSIDEEILRRVNRVALDTARGRTLEIVHCLRAAKEAGLVLGSVALYTGHAEDEEKQLLKFLRKIGVVETYSPKLTGGLSNRPKWRLTSTLAKLYDSVAVPF